MNTIERVMQLREKYYSSDAEFERELKLKPQTVNDWKRGKSKSYLKIIPQIAQTLNTTSAYLLCETNDPTPPSVHEATPTFGSVEWLRQSLCAKGYASLSDEQLSLILDNMDNLAAQFDKRNKDGKK